MAASTGLRREEMENWEQLISKVFCNGIIIRKLEKLMSYNDLKRCRRVSKEINLSIIAETDFISRTVVHVHKTSLLETNHFENFGFNVKHVKLHTLCNCNIPCSSDACLKELKEAQKAKPYATFADLKTLDCLKRWNELNFPFTWVREIILQSTELNELFISSLQMVEMDTLDETADVDRGELAGKLESVKSLEIKLLTGYECKFANLKKIKKLEKVKFEIVEFTNHCSEWAEKFVTDLLKDHRETLVELEMNLDNFTEFYESNLLSLHFPRLRVIKLLTWNHEFGGNDKQTVFANFLARHKNQLTSISFAIHNFLSETLCSVLNDINREKLEVLRIKSDSSNMDKLIKWEQFGKLKDMLLVPFDWIWEGETETFTSLWGRLPAGLNRIEIDRDLTRGSLRVLGDSSFQMQSTVTVLILKKIGQSIDGSVLHKIFEHMVQLKELRLECGTRQGSCNRTSFQDGFGGIVKYGIIKEENRTKSIANLKALRKLTIINFKISDKIVLDCIKFPELTQLCIYSKKLTFASFFAALAQNPLLEKLDLSMPKTKHYNQGGFLHDLVRKNYPLLNKCPIIGLRPNWEG